MTHQIHRSIILSLPLVWISLPVWFAQSKNLYHKNLSMVSLFVLLFYIILRRIRLYVLALYPLVIDKTLKSNDTQIIQSGGETVRGFFAACGDVICSMEGGLEAAEKVILHLLAPDQPEFSASFAGRLVTLTVLNAKSSNIQNILQAVLVKLNTVKTLTGPSCI